MKFKLAEVKRHECSKPACKHHARIERHHKGCQGMWVNHFKHRRSKRYKAYVEHYEAFHEEEIVRVCQPHHWEIHEILWVFIGREIRKSGLNPRDWSWTMAERLIDNCTKITDDWLARQTPGSIHKPSRRQPITTPSNLHRAKPRKS